MRVSAFLFLYRTLRLGIPLDAARFDMNKIWDPEENEVWQNFVKNALQKLDRNTFEYAADCFGFEVSDLKFLSGGHSGTPVFQFRRDSRDYVLRVALNEPDINKVAGMFEWMGFLSQHNAPVPGDEIHS
jgi:hypothetical protein